MKKDFRPDQDKNPSLEDKKTVDLIIVVVFIVQQAAPRLQKIVYSCLLYYRCYYNCCQEVTKGYVRVS